jgi:hypothetical protein
MFYAQKPFLRSVCFVAATMFGLAVFSTGLAQQGGAAVGQANPPPALNPDHPETYVVKPGDTLWDIAGMFLKDPWYWPEIWQVNPQIHNPHLIYPGDVLSMAYENGRPVVTVAKGGPGRTVRLSPRVRSEPLEQAIPTIPYATLRAFLTRSAVLQKADLKNLPYIVANQEGVLGSAGDDVYARRTKAAVGTVFNVVHKGQALIDPDDNTVLGYEGLFVGQGRVTDTGDPETVHLTSSTRESEVGDYLLPEQELTPANFLPKPPQQKVQGQIISVIDGVSLIGQYQVVVINRGARDGLERGSVLKAFQSGRTVRDTVSRHGVFAQKVRLPDTPAGTIMVFRTYDRMSYALVMEATRPITVLDAVRNP